MQISTAVFVALVLCLAAVAASAPDTALPTVFAGTVTPITNYMASAMGLVGTITFVAVVYIGTFDFPAHPLQLLSIAAYFFVSISSVIVL